MKLLIDIIIFGGFITFVAYLCYRFSHETLEEQENFLDEIQALVNSVEKLKSAMCDEIERWILDPLEAFLERKEKGGK